MFDAREVRALLPAFATDLANARKPTMAIRCGFAFDAAVPNVNVIEFADHSRWSLEVSRIHAPAYMAEGARAVADVDATGRVTELRIGTGMEGAFGPQTRPSSTLRKWPISTPPV